MCETFYVRLEDMLSVVACGCEEIRPPAARGSALRDGPSWYYASTARRRRTQGQRATNATQIVQWPFARHDNKIPNAFVQERPHHVDSTASRLLSEVKQRRAWLVLRWGTTLESQVLFFFFSRNIIINHAKLAVKQFSVCIQYPFLFHLPRCCSFSFTKYHI
jgi:hypothetical protein